MNKGTLFFLLLFFTIFCHSNTNAQNYIGVEGGGYFALRQTGLKIGLVSDFKINNFLSFHPELIYIQKGVSLPLEELAPEQKYRSSKIEYLQVPLLFQIRLDIKTFSFQLFAGPYISYGIKASAVNFDNINQQFQEQFSFDAIHTRRIDFGTSLGTSLVLDVGKSNKMFIDLRYNLGLRDLDKDPSKENFNEGTSMTMGFMIPFRKEKNKEER